MVVSENNCNFAIGMVAKCRHKIIKIMAQSAVTVRIDSEMTLEEINAEIRAAREERRKK